MSVIYYGFYELRPSVPSKAAAAPDLVAFMYLPLTMTVSSEGRRAGETVIWPSPPACTASPLLWGPNDRFRDPHQPASEGKFSVQGPVCEERGNFGRLQNSRGPASKGEVLSHWDGAQAGS